MFVPLLLLFAPVGHRAALLSHALHFVDHLLHLCQFPHKLLRIPIQLSLVSLFVVLLDIFISDDPIVDFPAAAFGQHGGQEPQDPQEQNAEPHFGLVMPCCEGPLVVGAYSVNLRCMVGAVYFVASPPSCIQLYCISM